MFANKDVVSLFILATVQCTNESLHSIFSVVELVCRVGNFAGGSISYCSNHTVKLNKKAQIENDIMASSNINRSRFYTNWNAIHRDSTAFGLDLIFLTNITAYIWWIVCQNGASHCQYDQFIKLYERCKRAQHLHDKLLSVTMSYDSIHFECRWIACNWYK